MQQILFVIRKYQSYIVVLFYIFIVLFLIFYIRSVDFEKLSKLSINYVYLIISLVATLAFRVWGVYIWVSLLRLMSNSASRNKNIRFSVELFFVYAKSWMGRYIPGTAPWILGKIYFASKIGLPKKLLAASSLLEGALQVTVLLGFSTMLLAFDSRTTVIPLDIRLLLLLVFIICVVTITPSVFNRLLNVATKIINKKSTDLPLINPRISLIGSVLYAIGGVFNGLGVFFLAKAIYPALDYSQILYVMGVGTLAGTVGMLVLFIPSGIGVKEGVMITLLSLIMPVEIAIIVTVASRLWDFANDLLFFSVGLLATRLQKGGLW